MTSTREVKESPLTQGEKDEVAYSFSWSGTPSDPAVELYEVESGLDVSADKLLGQARVSGSLVITPMVTDLEPGVWYRLVCLADIAGNKLSQFCRILGEE